MNAAEEKLMSIPVLGDAISSARTASREQFNNTAINRAVAPIGARVEGTGQAAVRKPETCSVPPTTAPNPCWADSY